jgi:RNA polymerase sigma factor (sigma-70 family)
MDVSDPSVVAKARDGDRDAFRALVDLHSRYIYSLAHRMTGNAQDAEDVVQEAWLKAHKQLSRFEARADFRTWLHRITVNCSIDLIRARRHREDAHDPVDLEQGPLSEKGAEAQATPERMTASAQISDRVRDEAMALAERAHAALGCRGVSRTDFRYDDTNGANRLIVLEVNTQPGMTPTSLVPEQAAYKGMNFRTLVRWILEDASCDR